MAGVFNLLASPPALGSSLDQFVHAFPMGWGTTAVNRDNALRGAQRPPKRISQFGAPWGA